jgi:NAD(P)-dependent dehydrogenase (short-subunit alcohol dehydrogenase family)
MLKDKVTLVTGAASGIGRAIALAYARPGAKVVVSDVNAKGGEETVGLIRKAGGGAIVNMASILGAVGFANAPAYAAAKHGVLGLTKTAAAEYGAHGVRVNAVGPGFIHTPMIAGLEGDPASLQQLIALHPIGRLGTPEEVAELVLWLSSPASSFATGAYYPVDGGYLSR